MMPEPAMLGELVSREWGINKIIQRQGRSFRILKGPECQADEFGHLQVDKGSHLRI